MVKSRKNIKSHPFSDSTLKKISSQAFSILAFTNDRSDNSRRRSTGTNSSSSYRWGEIISKKKFIQAKFQVMIQWSRSPTNLCPFITFLSRSVYFFVIDTFSTSSFTHPPTSFIMALRLIPAIPTLQVQTITISQSYSPSQPTTLQRDFL